MNDDFYIGWLPKAPQGFAKHIRKFLFVLLPLVVFTGVVIALMQKKFDTGNFEFGTLTEVKGIYFDKPVPLLKVINGKDIMGNISYITIPLVGYGKNGADGIMASIGKEKNIELDGRQVTITGTLLYNDGKILMQVSADDKPLTSVSSVIMDPALLLQQTDLGDINVRGEIIDPKCYFGVMKPGEGKVHEDCAIRCILGGIPPVMMVRNSTGEKNYYLVVGPHGEKMNKLVQDFVGEPVEITARLVRYDDWIIMYVKDNKMINHISSLGLFKSENEIVCCGPENFQALRDGKKENSADR